MSRGGRNCACCGRPWSNSGCVRGPTCRCFGVPTCDGCGRCLRHCECKGNQIIVDRSIYGNFFYHAEVSERRAKAHVYEHAIPYSDCLHLEFEPAEFKGLSRTGVLSMMDAKVRDAIRTWESEGESANPRIIWP